MVSIPVGRRESARLKVCRQNSARPIPRCPLVWRQLDGTFVLVPILMSDIGYHVPPAAEF